MASDKFPAGSGSLDYPPSFPRHQLPAAPADPDPGALMQFLRSGAAAKGLVVGCVALLAWTGGKVTSTGERLDQVERFMERAAPILESLGRGICLDSPARAQRDGLPCEALLKGAGYLTRPAAADGVAVFSTRAPQ